MILNLNTFKKEFKEIELGDKIYKIPADIPTLLYLELLESNQGDNVVKNMKAGLEIIYNIFKIEQPELEYDEFMKMITVNMYTAIINYIFADMTVEETKEALQQAKEQMKDGKKKQLPAEN